MSDPNRAPLGILMLDTRFPRIVGDIGNPETFPFPVLYETMDGIGPQQAVRDAPTMPAIVDKIAFHADNLVARGAGLITTSCGFLALFQRELTARCKVPVLSSSLLLVAPVGQTLKMGKRVGVITAEARSLTAAHLRACGAPSDTPVEGMEPGGAFAHTFLGNNPDLDQAAVCAETIDAGKRLLARHPDTGAIVLECTNLPPFAEALRQAIGLPVHDIGDLVRQAMV